MKAKSDIELNTEKVVMIHWPVLDFFEFATHKKKNHHLFLKLLKSVNKPYNFYLGNKCLLFKQLAEHK